MRITNNMMVQTMLNNMQRNVTRLNHSQNQYATGKRINRPSDDPLGINKSLRLRTDISSMDQFKRNVDDAYSFMDNTETAIRNMQEEGMNRVRELTVQASSETLTQEETIKIQSEIQEIRKQMIDLGNYTYSGKHIFSGTKTNQPLLDSQGYYQTDLVKHQDPRMRDDVWNFEVSTREKVQVNTLGFDVFEAESNEVLRFESVEPDAMRVRLPYKDGSGELEIQIVDGDAAPDRNDEGIWTVGADWNGADDYAELMNAVIENIKETTGDKLVSYEFTMEEDKTTVMETEDGDLEINDTTYLVAAPQEGIIVDNWENRAAWSISDEAFRLPDFDAEEEQRLTFNGVEIIIQQGDPDADDNEIILSEPEENRNKVILTVNGDPVAQDVESYKQAYTEALNQMADQRGSEIEGFTFRLNNGNLEAIAPERTGSMYNKSHFGGTVFDIPAEDREDFRKSQLISTGTSIVERIKEGQQAGLFKMLDKLEANLLAGKQEDLSNMLDNIDAHMNTMLTARSSVGAKSNRMELIQYRIEDDTLNFRELMSKIEDADMAEVTMNLMNEENVYRASLNVGARVIQPSLLDFLR